MRAGEVDVVLEYLDLCDKFWVKKGDRLSVWRSQIEKNEIPDFGANIRYHF